MERGGGEEVKDRRVREGKGERQRSVVGSTLIDDDATQTRNQNPSIRSCDQSIRYM